MTAFLLNLILALVWTAVTGEDELANLLIGFGVGYLVLLWLQPLLGRSAYFGKVPQALGFLLFYLWELLVSNLRVAWDVITPRAYRCPAIVAVPLDAETDLEITLLANLLTLTPGTLSIDVSSDRRVLYVHSMFGEDPAAVRQEIKESFERRVLALLR